MFYCLIPCTYLLLNITYYRFRVFQRLVLVYKFLIGGLVKLNLIQRTKTVERDKKNRPIIQQSV